MTNNTNYDHNIDPSRIIKKDGFECLKCSKCNNTLCIGDFKISKRYGRLRVCKFCNEKIVNATKNRPQVKKSRNQYHQDIVDKYSVMVEGDKPLYIFENRELKKIWITDIKCYVDIKYCLKSDNIIGYQRAIHTSQHVDSKRIVMRSEVQPIQFHSDWVFPPSFVHVGATYRGLINGNNIYRYKFVGNKLVGCYDIVTLKYESPENMDKNPDMVLGLEFYGVKNRIIVKDGIECLECSKCGGIYPLELYTKNGRFGRAIVCNHCKKMVIKNKAMNYNPKKREISEEDRLKISAQKEEQKKIREQEKLEQQIERSKKIEKRLLKDIDGRYELDMDGHKSYREPIKIKCKEHGWVKVLIQTLDKSLADGYRYGCPKCNKEKKTEISQRRLRDKFVFEQKDETIKDLVEVLDYQLPEYTYEIEWGENKNKTTVHITTPYNDTVYTRTLSQIMRIPIAPTRICPKDNEIQEAIQAHRRAKMIEDISMGCPPPTVLVKSCTKHNSTMSLLRDIHDYTKDLYDVDPQEALDIYWYDHPPITK